MKIVLTSQAEVLLKAWVSVTGNEFSGLADVWRQDGDLYIMNAHVLDVGTWGYTEIDPSERLKLPHSENRRCWFHRHPITTWSGMDMHTMTHEPCGSIPEMIQWAVAIVWTPKGWLGCLDTFVPVQRHFDLEVVSQGTPELVKRLAAEYAEENNLFQMSETMHAAFVKRHETKHLPDEGAQEFVRMYSDISPNQFRRMYQNEWDGVTGPTEVKVIKNRTAPRDPAIYHAYLDNAGRDRVPAPAPKPTKRKKTLIQKTFDWLLDKPKED